MCGTGTVSVLAMKQPHQQNSCFRNVEDGSSVDYGGSNIYHWCTKRAMMVVESSDWLHAQSRLHGASPEFSYCRCVCA